MCTMDIRFCFWFLYDVVASHFRCVWNVVWGLRERVNGNCNNFEKECPPATITDSFVKER